MRGFLSIAAVVFALILTALFRIIVKPATFVFFYAAVAVTSALAGLWGGVFSIVIAFLTALFFFYPPEYTFIFASVEDVASIAAFIAVSLLITALTEAQRRAKSAVDANVIRLQEQTAELHARNKEAQMLGEQLEESNVELETAIVEATEAREEAEDSRDRLNALLASLPDATVVCDRNWRLTFINAAGKSLFQDMGRDPEKLIGNVAWEMFPDAVGTPLYEALKRANGERTEGAVEFHVEQADKWFETRVLPVGDGVVAVARDITDRRRRESELRLLDAASRVLASSLDYETTINGVARLIVPDFADWCFVDIVVDEEIRQLAISNVDPEKVRWARELRSRFYPQIEAPAGSAEVIRTGEPRLIPELTDTQLQAVAKNEEHLDALRNFNIRSVIVVPLSARGRNLGSLSMTSSRRSYDDRDLGLAREIGWRAGVAVDNAQLYRAALAASEAKSNFLATISHELRTPLTAIIGYEELLAEGITGPVTPQQKQQLRRIKASASHLLGLIDEILTYTRLEAGRETVKLERVPVTSILDDVLSFTMSIATGKGIELRISPTPEPTLNIRTDPGKLRQILLNLLSNAVKFTEKGSVTLSAEPTDSDIVFAVADTGIGIDKESLEHIFDTFWQVQQQTTRTAGGSGLGLSVTKRLVELLGGEISVTSKPGEGTTFKVRLPREGKGAVGGAAPVAQIPEPSRGDGDDARGRKNAR